MHATDHICTGRAAGFKADQGKQGLPMAWLTVSDFFYTKGCETAAVTDNNLEILKYQMKAWKLR